MSRPTKFTAAERASFVLVAETCPDVERAMDEAFRPPRFDSPLLTEVLAKHGIERTRKLEWALEELIGRTLFLRRQALEKTVQARGTFPLRAALVQQLVERHGLENENAHYPRWIAEREAYALRTRDAGGA